MSVPPPPPGPIDTSLFIASGADLRLFVKTAEIDAPASAVFGAWATPEGWLRVYDRPECAANIDLRIGGRYEWLFDGEVGSNGCQVLSYIPDRMITFSWNAPPTQPETRARRTWVVVELESLAGDRTRVTLTHLGFGEGPAWDETRDYFFAAWDAVLARMGEKLGR